MARVALWLAITCIGVAIFFGLVVSRDVVDAWLMARTIDLSNNTWITQGAQVGVHLGAVILIGVPFTLLLYSLAAVGSDQPGTDIHGFTELGLKSGTRITMILLVALLVFVFVMAFGESASLIAQSLFVAGGLFFLWAGVWLLRLRLRFDRSVLLAPDYFGRMHRHEWSDLDRIESNREAMEYHLWFNTGKRARASYFLSGIDQLVERAQHALSERHAAQDNHTDLS